MDKGEPSLVPEWLKAGGAGSVQHAPHQDDKQRLHGESIDSPRYVPSRWLNDRSYDHGNSNNHKNGFSSGRYPNFSRSRGSNYDHPDRDAGYTRVDAGVKDRDLDGRWGQPSRASQEFTRRHISVGGGRPSENGERRNTENGPVSTFTGIVQKAVFDTNFPTLGAQEKPVHSNLANVKVISPRHHWQRPGDAANAALESWTSNLAEPVSNGVISASVSISGSSSSSPPAFPGPKMAEALAQSSPRVRTSPQAAEAQKMELELRKSRQLVPMTPTIPSIKPKPKMVTSISKPGTTIPLQPKQSPRPEPGKLLYLRTGTGSPRPDSGVVYGNGASSSASTVAPRKQKQLLDRKAVPIPPVSTGVSAQVETAPSSVRPRENGVGEDKSQRQNRSDFFATLRRKAAAGGSSGGKPDGEKPEKNVVGGCGGSGGNGGVGVGGGGGGGGGATITDGTTKEETVVQSGDSSGSSSSSSNGGNKVVAGANGVIEDGLCSGKEIVGGSEEEEEAAFLRSLGWKEDAEGAESALTEEEITEFLEEQKKHLRSKTSSPLSNKRHNRLQNAVLGLRADGGVSFGSDSEPDSKTRGLEQV